MQCLQRRSRKKMRAPESGALIYVRLVRPERFELPTPWFVAKYSIQMSYGRLRGPDYTQEIAEDKIAAARSRRGTRRCGSFFLRSTDSLRQLPYLLGRGFPWPLVPEQEPE